MKKLQFSHHFIPANKGNVEFFDIPLDEDIEAFIDPFLVANNRDDKIINSIYDQTVDFFTKLNRSFIKTNDRKNGLIFLSHLHEPNEYHLGYSDANKGKAISGEKATQIFDALRNNRFATAGVGITNEAHNVLLLVKGIGQDNISDVFANVCRNLLVAYTKRVCNNYKIPAMNTVIDYYDPIKKDWISTQAPLPHYKGKQLILVPKGVISGNRHYSSHYNWFIASRYISKELLSGKRPASKNKKMIVTLTDGTKKAIIKEIYRFYKKPKDELIEFVKHFTGSLDEFLRYAKEHYPELDLDKFLGN